MQNHQVAERITFGMPAPVSNEPREVQRNQNRHLILVNLCIYIIL